MRMHRRSTIIVMAATVVSLVACDGTATPTVAVIGGAPGAAANGRAALVISPNRLTLSTGSTFPLDTNAPTSLQNQLQWTSLNSTVASVSPSGSIFGAGPGSATITVRYSNDTTNVGTATITVTGPLNTGDRIPMVDP